MEEMIMYYRLIAAKCSFLNKCEVFKEKCLEAKHPGIDGILVTVGLCIIALLLCVFMKEQLTSFIKTIVGEMTTKATTILGTPITP